MLNGREIFHLEGNRLVRRLEYFGPGRWQTFDLPAVENVRFEIRPSQGWIRFQQFRKLEGPMSVHFDYHRDAESVGLELDEEEALRLVAAIKEAQKKAAS